MTNEFQWWLKNQVANPSPEIQRVAWAAWQHALTLRPEGMESLQMQTGYLATKLMVAGDPRSLPEIVKEAADACSPQSGSA